jgi:hypothetical protein
MNCFSHYRHAINGAGLRRFLAVLVAATFLATGVIHAATCLDSAPVGPAGIAVVTGIMDDSANHDGDSPNKATLDIIHCHGCSAVTVPMATPHIVPVTASSNVVAAATYAVDADQRLSDPPPPKS